jgi:hypothetical protein
MKIKKRKNGRTPAEIAANSTANLVPAAPMRAATNPARSAARAIGREDIAFTFHKQWNKAIATGDYDLLWDLTAEGSAIRESFGSRDEFPSVARRRLRPLDGIVAGEVERTRIVDHDEALLLVVHGTDSRTKRPYTAERWYMVRGELGWRLHDIATSSHAADAPVGDISFDEFPSVTPPSWYAELSEKRAVSRKEKRTAMLSAREELLAMRDTLAKAAPAPEA